jgi:quinol monooxygenase YgiN
MYGLSVRFTCKDKEAAAGFDELVSKTVPQIRKHEAGTVVYAVHTVEGKPLERIFYELYRDKAAFDAHEEQEHTRQFLRAREQFLASVDVDRLTLQAGKGTDG